MKCLVFIIIILVWLSSSAQRWSPTQSTFDSIFASVDRPFLSLIDEDSLDEAIGKLKVIVSNHPDNPIMDSRIKYLESVKYLLKGRPDSCASVCERILENLDRVKYPYDWHRVNLRYNTNQTYKLSYVEKYKSLKTTLDYFTSIEDSVYVANTLVSMGNLLHTIGWNEKSLETHDKAYDLYMHLGLKDIALKSQINRANCIGALRGDSAALVVLESIKDEPSIQADTTAYMQVLHAICFHGDNSPYKEWAARKAYVIACNTGKEDAINHARINLGAFYVMNGKPDSALFLYQQALDFADETENSELILPAITGISLAFEKMEQWDSAYIYRVTRENIVNTLQNENKDEELQLAESRALIQQHEEKMGLLREKSRSQRMALIMCLALVVCIAIGVAYWLWDRRAKAQAKSDMIALQLENQKLQADLMAQRMEQNERELTSNAILLTEHQNTLTRLKESITKESQSGEISKQAERVLKSEILAHSGTENRWEYFFIHFNQMHPDFFDNLKAVCPSLTKGETRICAYIRIGMDNKQIAELLSIEASSVKQARYRIRKKLALATTESLENFLNTISPYNGLNLNFT